MLTHENPPTATVAVPGDPATPNGGEPARRPSIAFSDREGGRIPTLDGLRGLAVALVFMFHCTVIADIRTLVDGQWVIQIPPLDRFFVHLTFLNGLAPLLFFVLSGFLITGILKGTRDHPHYFRNFYARRALRIMPLYYAVVFFSLVVLPMLPMPAAKAESFGRIGADGWMYWTFLANFGIADAHAFRHGILDVTWSLSVEEQYYVIWPLLVFFLGRRALVGVCLGMFAFGFLFRFYFVFIEEGHPIAAYVLTWGRLGSLGLGSLIALVWKDPGVLDRLRKPAAVIAILTLPAIWLTTAAEQWAGISYLGLYGVRGGPISRTIIDSFATLGLASLLVRALVARPTEFLWRLLCSRPIGVLAKYSYGVFLFHLPIRAVIRDLVYGPHKPPRLDAATGQLVEVSQPLIEFPMVLGSLIPAQLVFYAVALAATLPAAALSWHLYEKQFLRFKDRFKYTKPTPIGTEKRPRVEATVLLPRGRVFPIVLTVLGLCLLGAAAFLGSLGQGWRFAALNTGAPGILTTWMGICGLWDWAATVRGRRAGGT